MDSDQKTVRSYDDIYNSYINTNGDLNQAITEALDHFISFLKGNKVIDIGCAGGRDIEYFIQKGLTPTGVDVSAKFIGYCHTKFAGLKFYQADMLDLSCVKEKYDGLWSNASILHISKTNVPKVLANFRSLLKKQGILYLSVMEGDFEGYRQNKDMDWPERYFSDYNPAEITEFVQNAGFKVLKIVKSPTPWGPVFIRVYAELRLDS